MTIGASTLLGAITITSIVLAGSGGSNAGKVEFEWEVEEGES